MPKASKKKNPDQPKFVLIFASKPKKYFLTGSFRLGRRCRRSCSSRTQTERRSRLLILVLLLATLARSWARPGRRLLLTTRRYHPRPAIASLGNNTLIALFNYRPNDGELCVDHNYSLIFALFQKAEAEAAADKIRYQRDLAKYKEEHPHSEEEGSVLISNPLQNRTLISSA